MARKVFVTGMGAITSIGSTVDENLESLRKGQDGLAHPSILKTKHDHLFVGEVKLTNEELAEKLSYFREPVTRSSLLALHAMNESIAHRDRHLPERIGLFSANTGGGMSLTEKYYMDYFKRDAPDEVFDTVENHHCSDSTEVLLSELRVPAISGTISTACSSSANTIMYGARLIRAGRLDMAICGGVEALSLFTLNGFRSLKIMDEAKCRPFDKARKGLNLGEGAAFIVLESERSVLSHKTDIICELSGWANTNDAYHQTATSPRGDGARAAVKQALHMAQVVPLDIGYVNAHGTGTDNNDLTEASAMDLMFSPDFPNIGSTKSYTGHTLGAAGSIETVFSILAMMNDFVPAGLRLTDPVDHVHWTPIMDGKELSIINTLNCSFGFGGNTSALLFSAL